MTPESWPDRPLERPTVLHVRVLAGSGGGPERSILGSAAPMSANGYWVGAAYLHPPDEPALPALQRRASAQHCPFIPIHDRGALDRRPIRQLLDLCRHLDVRIWHAHDYKSDAIGLLLRRFHRMALVTTVHGWVTLKPRLHLYYAIDRRCLRRYDHVVSVSPHLDEQVRRLGVPAERRSLLLNGVDCDLFSRRARPADASLRTERKVPPGRLVIGAVGRLSGEKRFVNLIHAVHRLVGEGRDVALWIVGEGEERPALQALIDRLGLVERVELLGFVEDTREVYAACDAFVLCSVREGLPNVLLEAMAMEVPSVATNIGGVPELVDDGANGLLCPPEDVTALTSQLRRLFDDEALRSRLARAGRQTVETKFRFGSRITAERNIYDRLIDRRS